MKKMLLYLFICFAFSQAYAQWSLDVSSGLAFQSYNDVRIPNQTGTTFSFNDDFQIQGPVIPIRLRLTYRFGERNHLLALFAPLSIDYKGQAPFDISFQQSLFQQGAEVEGFYKFNSYRVTYRRDVLITRTWTLGIGFTGKIRDASVRLQAGDIRERKDDVGFVPLLHVFASWNLDGWSIILEGDGLAGGPGRAFDFLLGGRIPLSQSLALNAGYRILEGGADVDEVYNFTLINFAVVGFTWQF